MFLILYNELWLYWLYKLPIEPPGNHQYSILKLIDAFTRFSICGKTFLSRNVILCAIYCRENYMRSQIRTGSSKISTTVHFLMVCLFKSLFINVNTKLDCLNLIFLNSLGWEIWENLSMISIHDYFVHKDFSDFQLQTDSQKIEYK